MQKTLTRAGLAALALTGIACLLTVPGLAEEAAHAAGRTAAQLQQGRRRLDDDVDGARPADDDPRPGAVLCRPGPTQECTVGADPRLLHGLHRDADLGDLRLQPHLHRRHVDHRRLRQALPQGRHRRIAGRHVLGRRTALRDHLHLLPDDLRGDHAGADRRRLRGTHEVLCGGAVHSAVGDLRLLPDRAHGLVLGRPGRDRRSRQGARRCDRRQQGRAAGQARRRQCRLRTDLRLGRHRLRGRHRGAHQCRHRRTGRRDHGRQAHRLRQGADASPLAGHDHDRRRAALGRLVRLQRRFRA